MTNISELRDKFRAREKTVTLVADGPLLAEHERLSAELEAANNNAASSLAADPRVAELATAVKDCEQRISDATVSLRFRGLGRNAFRRLLADHASDDGAAFDKATFPQALVAACSLDPVMTVADVESLADLLSDGQFDSLFQAAWDACREVDGVPFNGLASILTRD